VQLTAVDFVSGETIEARMPSRPIATFDESKHTMSKCGNGSRSGFALFTVLLGAVEPIIYFLHPSLDWDPSRRSGPGLSGPSLFKIIGTGTTQTARRSSLVVDSLLALKLFVAGEGSYTTCTSAPGDHSPVQRSKVQHIIAL
jgi:hypothetical protein